MAGKTVITFGTFDVLHVGHVRVLNRSAALGDGFPASRWTSASPTC